ncbi:hypothetical protein ISU02_09610 [Fusibacter sp. Q10-2]|uniref:Uncharacterized protein n=1 Tax=Fusibacter ferrireducens TaxID=2785058 RepID=A0ABR9ZSE5_9FIRM|nr:hypothetical protein [Fusibacter ferrireducens]
MKIRISLPQMAYNLIGDYKPFFIKTTKSVLRHREIAQMLLDVLSRKI